MSLGDLPIQSTLQNTWTRIQTATGTAIAPTTVPAAPSAAPAIPAAPAAPTMPAAVNSPAAAIPADTLEIGGQLFGKPVGFGQVRQLADNLKPEDAAAITKDDGLDKIFFKDEAGKNYVFFSEKSHFEDVRAGYLGRFNGSRIQVVAVDDEANTFSEGFASVWKWLNGTVHDSFGSEASKSISGIVATTIGSFVAAAAIKTSAPAVPLALPAASGILKGIGNSAMNILTGFMNTMASVVLFVAGGIGAVSLIQGVRGYLKKGNMRTMDMITGNF